MPESLPHKRSRTADIVALLKRTYPHAQCSLDYTTPWQLLVATILSAQCTDVRVNLVTPVLFQQIPTPQAMAAADLSAIERLIQTTGFFRNKAKALKAAAADIVAKHGGLVPQTMDDLTALHGVGRKTANVVLGNAFGQNVGIVVDTHVSRLAQRLGLTRQTNPVRIEQDLIALVDPSDWTLFSHLLIHHGRALCTARNPACERCPLSPLCPAGQKFLAQRHKPAAQRGK